VQQSPGRYASDDGDAGADSIWRIKNSATGGRNGAAAVAFPLLFF
jgi:hypothetical protein